MKSDVLVKSIFICIIMLGIFSVASRNNLIKYTDPDGRDIGRADELIINNDYSKIIELMKADAQSIGYTCKETTFDADVVSGHWKIVLAVTGKDCMTVDYHFYRLNDDVTWSQKPGNGDVLVIDDSDTGKTIFNPKEADRGIYEVFVVFFLRLENEIKQKVSNF